MVARNHLYIDGYLGAPGLESWSVGIAYAGPEGEVETDATGLQEWATGVAAYLGSATLTGLMSMLSTSAGITGVRTYFYPGPGPAAAAGEALLATPRVGTGTISKPAQCAAVFTLLTGLAGRRYRGRFYWPWLGTGYQGSTMQGILITGTATDAAAMLNAMGAEAGGVVPLLPQVYSRAGDFLTPVSQVRVDNIVDTQRRRRDNLEGVAQVASV